MKDQNRCEDAGPKVKLPEIKGGEHMPTQGKVLCCGKKFHTTLHVLVKEACSGTMGNSIENSALSCLGNNNDIYIFLGLNLVYIGN